MEGGKSLRGTRAGKWVKGKKKWQNMQNFILQLALECISDQSTNTCEEQCLIDSNKSSTQSSSSNINLLRNDNIVEVQLSQNPSVLLNANQQSEKNNTAKFENGKDCSAVTSNDDDKSSESKYTCYRGVRAGKVAKQNGRARRMSMFLQSLANTYVDDNS